MKNEQNDQFRVLVWVVVVSLLMTALSYFLYVKFKI